MKISGRGQSAVSYLGDGEKDQSVLILATSNFCWLNKTRNLMASSTTPSFDILEYVATFNTGRPVAFQLSPLLDQQLLGPQSPFDSVDFVDFILGLEEAVAKVSGTHISLMDEEWLVSGAETLLLADISNILSDKMG